MPTFRVHFSVMNAGYADFEAATAKEAGEKFQQTYFGPDVLGVDILSGAGVVIEADELFLEDIVEVPA